MWQVAGDADAPWAVDVLQGGTWVSAADPITHVRVDVGRGNPVHRVYKATLANLPAGGTFHYRVRLGADTLFQDQGTSLKTSGQRQRVVVAGDWFTLDPRNHQACHALARRAEAQNPDLLVIPGDMVNLEGFANQYRDTFFPGLNGGAPGATLLRHCAVVPCLGNNDTERLFEKRAGAIPQRPRRDSLAWYYYFSAPLNGPALDVNLGHPAQAHDFLTPVLDPAANGDLLAAAGANYPRMGNFSFDSGDVHWTVLDSCPYMEWAFSHPLAPSGWAPRTPAAEARLSSVKAWLAADLAAAAGARWKFVVFHHPAFNLALVPGWTYHEGWMRQIWPILQDAGVNLVFNGHLHCYQRSRPLAFAARPASTPESVFYRDANLGANLVEDLAFTGTGSRTRAQGVIQILTGNGGANPRPYPAPPDHLKAATRPWPAALDSAPARGVYGSESFSLLEIDGDRLEFRQIRSDGTVVDRFTLTR